MEVFRTSVIKVKNIVIKIFNQTFLSENLKTLTLWGIKFYNSLPVKIYNI